MKSILLFWLFKDEIIQQLCNYFNGTQFLCYKIIRKKPLVPGPDMRAAKGGGSGTKGGGVVTDIKFGGFAVRIAISNVFNIPMTGVICDC